ncbi:dephospho-CoA kinase [Pseudidiomarina donghaiensis]|uniref:Dephospho-CoA kinase n=1 Tax=Pseudidiomarina donghaiensis TaxID=519452 RepID=A0A432XKL0_9GAMM|nr:dephospho-CoA kinase [Pseudidiomarina donghaiensis]RUO49187.1 dephospho-CoA kinase [Pseudidiomarina donghaiensis]SFV20731.1 dephospho-CoA kinase [Pseudidiomarina donghaiensis]
MFVVGVTGGIGSGKTTVTDLFYQQGIDVVDADVIARGMMNPGSAALEAVKQRFGEQALQPDGGLNRSWLRERIFAHPEDKTWLNNLTHPLVREQLLQQVAQAQSPYVILSAPLLIENRLTQLCDRVLVVDVSEATQIARTASRDNTNAEQVQAIIAAQASREQRLAAADNVIDNNGAVEELPKHVEKLHELYLRLAANKQATR